MTPNEFAWASAIIAATGAILVNYKSYYGMVLWLIANMMWVYYGLFVQINHPQVFMYLVFTATSLHGIYKWKIQK